MEIEFVNHSSFITQGGEVRLLCDPWLEGTAFNDGWALISPTSFGYDDFARVSHVWFSHEHPDHFAPANLRKIPEPIRAQLTVMYQQTRDRKVIGYCEKQGFGEVRELELGHWMRLGPDFEVLCGAAPHGDSWMAIRSGGKTLLNLNDCGILTPEEAAPVREQVGAVDVLATQFSLSAWEGNPEEVERRRRGARQMLERCIFHAQFFAPKWVIPFASYVWFCHEENFYINAEHIRVDEVAEALRARTQAQPLVMYPGDRWTVGEAYDPQPAIDRHVADFESLPSRPRASAKPYSEQELMDAAEKFRQNMIEHASRLRLDVGLARAHAERALSRLKREHKVSDAVWLAKTLLTVRPRPARVYLWDRQQAYLFDLMHGLRRSSLPREQCDMCCGTDSLVYAFKFLWGGESLQVNGRFHEVYPGGRAAMFDYFHLAESFNRGETLNWQTVARRVARALRFPA